MLPRNHTQITEDHIKSCHTSSCEIMSYIIHISTPWYFNFSCVILYLSDIILCTSIFAQFLLFKDKDCHKFSEVLLWQRGFALRGTHLSLLQWKNSLCVSNLSDNFSQGKNRLQIVGHRSHHIQKNFDGQPDKEEEVV